MSRHLERALVRILIGAALCVALLASALVPVPEDAAGNALLPATAFNQAGLYRLEIALLVFYGVLLLVTPAFLGLARGRLPIEISVRGARFEEKTNQSVELTEAKIEELKQKTQDLADALTVATFEIDQLKKGLGDNT
jgi:hypothetical protein